LGLGPRQFFLGHQVADGSGGLFHAGCVIGMNRGLQVVMRGLHAAVGGGTIGHRRGQHTFNLGLLRRGQRKHRGHERYAMLDHPLAVRRDVFRRRVRRGSLRKHSRRGEQGAGQGQ